MSKYADPKYEWSLNGVSWTPCIHEGDLETLKKTHIPDFKWREIKNGT